jgi:dTDP-L-rhamnose 4-epimerase
MRVLLTGGTGFIGSHIADVLHRHGYQVRILHRGEEKRNPNFEYHQGDLLDTKSLGEALQGVDVVSHQAALGGFGSTYSDYVRSNCLRVSNLIDVLEEKQLPVHRIVFASSQNVYGEGAYRCGLHDVVRTESRSVEQLESHDWELHCSICRSALKPIATPESKHLDGSHIYAISKHVGERIFTTACHELGIDLSILRYSLVYGPREASFRLCSTFSEKIFNSVPITLHEDGNQLRDFVYVGDVAQANLFVLDNEISGVYNIGTGVPTTLRQFAGALSYMYDVAADLSIDNTFRYGDTRHLFSDITKLGQLGFSPEISLQEGLEMYRTWIDTQMGGLNHYFGGLGH